MSAATVCLPCWVAWNPDEQKRLRDHPPRTCRVRWVEDGKSLVCMCSCARRDAAASPLADGQGLRWQLDMHESCTTGRDG